jgi:hypothetical protein
MGVSNSILNLICIQLSKFATSQTTHNFIFKKIQNSKLYILAFCIQLPQIARSQATCHYFFKNIPNMPLLFTKQSKDF